MAGRVRIARDDGELGTVDEADLPAALESGFRVVDETEAAEVKLRRDAASASGLALGGVEAAGRGISFGLTDLAARELGADMEGMQARRSNIGDLGTGIELVAAAAPALLTGGASAGAGAAGRLAVATPAGAAARLGLAAAGRAGGGKLRQYAVQGAVEGALQGMGEVVSEDSLGDRDLAAERLLVGAARGGTLGGLLGGGMGAAGAGLANVARGGQRVSRAALERVAGLGDDLADPAVKAALAKGGDVFERVQHVQLTAMGASAEAHGALSRLSGLARSREGRALLSEAQQAPKAWDSLVGKRLGSAWKSTDPAAALERYGKAFAADARKAGTASTVERMAAFERRVQRMVKDGASTEARAAAEEALAILHKAGGGKRWADNLTKERIPNAHRWLTKTTDEIGAALQRRKGTFGAEEINGLLQPVRELADDPLLWGGRAKHAKALYAAKDAERAALDALPAKARKALEAGDLDDAAAVALAKTPKTLDVLEARSKLADVLEQAGEDVTELRRGVEDARRALAYRGELQEVSGAWKAVRAVEDGPQGKIARKALESAGTLVGGFSGGLAGAFGGRLVGEVLQGATRPAAVLATMARLRQTVDAVAGREGAAVAGVERLVEGGAKAAKAAGRAGAGAAKAGGRVARGAAGKADDGKPAARGARAAALDQIRRTVVQLAAKPTEIPDKMGEGMHEIRQVAPRIADAMAARTSMAIAFLASKAPTPFSPPFSSVSLIDPVALDRFGRYVDAVQDPIGAVERIERGGLALEHAEALRAVYPAIYNKLRSDVLKAVGRRAQGKNPVSHQARIQLSLLLQLPLDQAMTPGFIERLGATAAPAQPQAAPAGQVRAVAGVEAPTAARTSTDRLEAGGMR